MAAEWILLYSSSGCLQGWEDKDSSLERNYKLTVDGDRTEIM